MPETEKTLSASQMESRLLENKCTPFQFLALYEAHGFREKFHGILGLSPKKNETMRRQHFLWNLKEYGIVDRAMVSFSITQTQQGQKPYVTFGGYNSS